MIRSILASATVALGVSAVPSFAAGVDLSAFGLTQGALLAESNAATITFDSGFDFLEASVDDGSFVGVFNAFPSDPTSAFMTLGSPEAFAGGVIAYDIDATSAAGLFFDSVKNKYLYGLLTLGTGEAFDFTADSFLINGATAQLYAVTPTAVIPLPAAASLMLAGLGALAVAGHRRKA